MKKMFIFLALLSVTIGTISAQDLTPNKRLKSGFWMKLGYDATFSNFLYADDETHFGSNLADLGVDAQLGTTFYLGPRIGNMLRFGLDACWLDFSYFKLNDTYFHNGTDLFLNFLEIGPKISFSPVKYIAFDLYGRVVPSFSLLFYDETITNSSTNYSYTGFNVSGLVGASFRLGVFEMGVEYNFGKMKYIDTKTSDNSSDSKVNTDNLRILLGFKF